MSTETNKVGDVPKTATARDMRSFEADEDVGSMLNKAAGRGIKTVYLCNTALRRLLTEMGFAAKKEAAFEPVRKPAKRLNTVAPS